MSDTAKYTKGAWRAEPTPGGGCLLIRDSIDKRISMQTAIQIVPTEDARLMACAPEMAEMLLRLHQIHGYEDVGELLKKAGVL